MKLFGKKLLAGLLAVTLVLSMVPAGTMGTVHAAEDKHIQILQTSDLHGKFVPFSYAINEASDGSLAQVATIIKERRDDNTILVDGGDTIQDNSANLFLDDEIHPMIKGLNLLGYDYWVAGNHEFNYGVPTLQKVAKTFEGKFLCGNVYDKDGNALGLSYDIVEKDGVKVAVIGMVTPNITRWDGDNLKDYKVTNPIDEIKAVLEQIKDDVDVIVGVIHADTTTEYEVNGSGVESIIDACPEFDVVMASHGHQQVNKDYNGVLVTENGSQGATLVDIDITVTEDGAGGYKVTDKKAELVSTKGVAADEEIVTELASYDERAKEDALVKVGVLEGADLVPTQEIEGITQAQIQETAMINLINQVQMYYGKAEVSAAAAFSPTANMKKGDIRRCDTALVYKFDNTLYRLEMTGKQLRQYMEWSVNYYNTFKKGDLTVSFNPNMRSYLYDMFGGVQYEVNISKEPGKRIENLRRMDGTKIKNSDKITIAVNNYRANSQLLTYGSVYFEENGDTLPKLLEKDIMAGESVRGMIGKWIVEKKKGTITPDLSKNWKITGKSWNSEKHNKVVALAAAGLLSVPSSDDGRTPNVKSVTEDDLKAFSKVKTYRIKFYGNGGLASGDSLCYVDGTRYGKVATAYRKGYTFKGWYTKSSGGKKLTTSQIKALKKSTIVYAHWSKKK